MNFCQALADEVEPHGIRVNVVSPQRAATKMRVKAFGREKSGSLLSADKVAKEVIKCCVTQDTGLVFDVRK